MTSLGACPKCGGFVPGRSESCPLCDARSPRSLRSWLTGGVLGIVGGGTLAVTLSACYGAPCAGGACYEPDAGRYCIDPASDTDGDGFCGVRDCDETSDSTHELATDPVGDGIDQNCDGVDGIAVDGGP